MLTRSEVLINKFFHKVEKMSKLQQKTLEEKIPFFFLEKNKKAKLTTEQRKFVSYLKTDFYEDLNQYENAEVLIQEKFAFRFKDLHPKLQGVMNGLLQKTISICSNEQYRDEMTILLDHLKEPFNPHSEQEPTKSSSNDNDLQPLNEEISINPDDSSTDPGPSSERNELIYSGRILVDFSKPRWLMEFEFQGQSERQVAEDPIVNPEQAIEKLIDYGLKRGIEKILLINQDFFINLNVPEQSKSIDATIEKMLELSLSEKSFLIINADSIDDLANDGFFQTELERLREFIFEFANSSTRVQPDDEHWVALLSSKEESSNLMRASLSWPQPLECL